MLNWFLMKVRNIQSGQALVLVLLSLAVVLTLVLFILARSVTDVAITSTQEESVRAFSAAEAGVESALVVGLGSGTTQIGSATYKTTVASYAQGSSDFVYPVAMASGDSATTWFMSHDADGNLICSGSTYPCFTGSSMKVCWGKEGTASNASTTPAVELIIYYETTPNDLSTLKIARAAFDPNAGRLVSNSFSSASSTACQIGGVNYAFQSTVNFSDLGVPAASYNNAGGLQFARMRMFYNTDATQEMGVTVAATGNTLPSQGSQVDSTGIAGTSNRRISVFQGWPEVPSIFEYAVYSSTGLTK